MFSSIRLRLIAWFVLVFSIVFTGLGLFLYYKLRETVIGSVDRHIESEVTLLAGILAKEIEHGHLDEGINEITSAATGEYSVPLSGHYYQLVTADGRVIGRSPSLSLADKSLPITAETLEPVYTSITGPEGKSLRMMSRTFEFDIVGRLTFQAADPLEDAYFVLRSFRNMIILVIPGIFLVSVCGIYFIANWAFGAINIFSEKVEHITERSLGERLDEYNADKELKPLARGFNIMIENMEKSFDRQKQFLSNASHELRTPTSVIKSYCDVMLKRERSAEEYRDALSKVSEVVDRMCVIINQILEISRTDSKSLNLRLANVSLSEIMRTVFRIVEHNAVKKNVKINMVGAESDIIGDRWMLTEVFINLIDNAVKYNRPGGSVDIDISRNNGWSVVTVEDTGIGIPEADRDKIFDRFYRVDYSRSGEPGSGLGLSIVRAIVERHNGRIEVESELGKGACFRVFLPNDRRRSKREEEIPV
ncbi:MAG: hypothetical protein HY880_08645 [Deltaproteobacteria bacterium]|nr:hypothetical protein [Deltaproteobacteria bacterium]